jgi:hypothetical protein
MMMIGSFVRTLVADHLGVSVGRVPDEAHLADDLGADWLDRLELMMVERDRNPKRAVEPASQAMNTEKTNGESTPPAITSFSPARSGALSPRKWSPMGSPLTIVPRVLQRSRT